jgi:hypothetical protein
MVAAGQDETQPGDLYVTIEEFWRAEFWHLH